MPARPVHHLSASSRTIGLARKLDLLCCWCATVARALARLRMASYHGKFAAFPGLTIDNFTVSSAAVGLLTHVHTGTDVGRERARHRGRGATAG